VFVYLRRTALLELAPLVADEAVAGVTSHWNDHSDFPQGSKITVFVLLNADDGR
jgi:hypothetical protein